MSISFDTLTKVYKSRTETEIGIEVYESFNCIQVFYPFDVENTPVFYPFDVENIPEGLAILEYLVNEDLEFDEELRDLLCTIDECDIVFIDGERYEWEEIKDILAKLNKDSDIDEEEEEDND